MGSSRVRLRRAVTNGTGGGVRSGFDLLDRPRRPSVKTASRQSQASGGLDMHRHIADTMTRRSDECIFDGVRDAVAFTHG